MIDEYCDLPSPSSDPKRASQTTDILPTDSSANTQLQTEHANGQIKLTFSADGQTELIDGHTKRQTEQMNIANGQIKPSANTQLQTEHADGSIKFADGQTELDVGHKQVDEHTSDWSDNLIKIIKNIINVPCKTPAAQKLSFELLTMAASHNLAILLKYNNGLNKELEANKNSLLGYGSEFRHP